MDDWFKDPFFNTPTDHSHIEQDIKRQISEVEKHMVNMMESMNSMFKNFGSMGAFGLDYDDKNRSASAKHSTTAPGLTYHPTFSDSGSDFSQTTGNRTSSSRYTSSKDPIIEYPDDDMKTTTGSRKYNDTTYNRSRTYDRTSTIPNRTFNDTSNSANRETKPYIYVSAMSSFTGPDGIQQARKKTYDSESGKTRMAEMRRLGDQAIAMKREIDRDGKITDTIDRKNVDEKDVNDFRKRWDTKANQMSLSFRNTTGNYHQNALK